MSAREAFQTYCSLSAFNSAKILQELKTCPPSTSLNTSYLLQKRKTKEENSIIFQANRIIEVAELTLQIPNPQS
jgi:cobalamin biosynthesis Co2+ chelatase CbiK